MSARTQVVADSATLRKFSEWLGRQDIVDALCSFSEASAFRRSSLEMSLQSGLSGESSEGGTACTGQWNDLQTERQTARVQQEFSEAG